MNDDAEDRAQQARGRHVRAGGWSVLTGLLRSFTRPYAGPVILVVTLVTIQAAGSLYLPTLNADIIDNGVLKGDASYIWRTGGLMLGIALALCAVSVLTVYWASRVSISIGANMRAAIYQRVQAFSAEEMSRFGIPSLITRNINDVQQVQTFLETMLTTLVLAVILNVGGVILAIREGGVLSVVLALAIPVMFIVIGVTVNAVVPLFRSMQGKIDRINQVLREQITGARVIRAFMRTGFERDRFRAVNADLTRVTVRVNRTFALVIPVLVSFLLLSGVAVMWFGGRLVSEGALPIGNLTACFSYVLQSLLAVTLAVDIIISIPRAVASAERIDQVIRAVPAITDPPRPVTPASVTGIVEFRHVTFGYPGGERPVLHDLTFVLRPGQTSAIIGGTGSGKTTLLNLIPRFFDATSGAVLVNETDVREQSAEELWATIGLVPQTAFVFGGTVASLLRFGQPAATDEQLWHALEVAQALDFVASMPGELQARIDQGGSNVSGGQRQRLCLARALVRRPRLYLLDDCFSALDTGTDARLRAALRADTRDASVVIVAQRVSTIMHADQIIVLDAGRIAGIGTHDQLLTGCGPYQEIVTSQLGAGLAR
jgi:ABC-type multidrug transport system fused ATPase/permease subunit